MRYNPVKCILTEDELRTLLPEWQERLRLQDWLVTIQIASYAKMEGDRQGLNSFIRSTKQSSIKILCPEDYPENCLFPHDMEVVLVHELIHLLLADWDAEEQLMHRSQEAAVDSLAMGLVQLKRECNATA